MLAKKERLTVAAFNEAFRNGQRVHGQHVQLIYAAGDSFQAAAVVGKKVYKKAVDRNRLRRQMYAVLAGWHKQHKVSGVFICIAKPTARQVSFTDVSTDILALLAKTTPSL